MKTFCSAPAPANKSRLFLFASESLEMLENQKIGSSLEARARRPPTHRSYPDGAIDAHPGYLTWLALLGVEPPPPQQPSRGATGVAEALLGTQHDIMSCT